MANHEDRGPRSGLSARVIDVLVVDDDPDTLHLMRAYLELHGCAVRTASDVREAMDRIRESVPDAVISDLDLGDALDGWALAEALRNHDHTRHVARIAVSGHAREPDALGAFDAHLQKPVELCQLLDAIQRITAITRSIRPRITA